MPDIKITFNGEVKIFSNPVTVLDVIGDNKDYIAAYVNRRVRELTYVIDKDSEIVPLTLKDSDAKNIYEASVRFLVAMAMHNIYPNYHIRFSYNVSRSIFMQIIDEGITSNGQMVIRLIEEMKRLVALDLPLKREIMSKEEAFNILTKLGYQDKADVMKYRPEKTAHLYDCGGYKNYMYSRMVPSTGYISKWIIWFYHPGIIIQYPRSECNGEIPVFEDAPTFGKTLKRAHTWAKSTNVDTVVGINKHIEEDGAVDFINLCEARHNQQICEIGDMIQNDIDSIRLICIAGPSSSGKTTFANKLRIELKSRGINPIRISLDDYYKSREEIPLDENGEYDFETIEALDVELFNKNMSDLISGLTVALPEYNFKKNAREFTRIVHLEANQPIIIEGIHALNPKMTSGVPSHQKFEIFIAPQAQIAIDNENPLSLTDLRLLRRIVRDYQFRNSSALDTISMWSNVRKGEFKWIYGTQEGADYVFNSLLSYELSVMKKHAMPLLLEIETDSKYFPIAERLIRMLKFFEDLPDDMIPNNSLIREFIGGSCFADV